MMEYQTPVKRPRTRESSATANHHLYYNSGIHIDERTTIHIQQILSSLQQVVASKQRVAVLQQLLSFLVYDPSTRLFQCPAGIVLQFLERKCVHLLCLQLGYALYRFSITNSGECEFSRNNNNNPSNEIHLIFIALDAFYRQCPRLVTEESIRNSGSEVLRLSREVLVQDNDSLLQEMLGRNRNHGNDLYVVASTVRSIVSIWHSFSSFNLGTILLLQNPETLRILNNILSTQKKAYHRNGMGEMETIMECLGLLKNLSYYGEDYRHRIVNQPDFLSTLTSLADVPNGKARERLSAVFRNLALSVDVRSLLTQRADVLAAIFRMSNFRGSHTTTSTDSACNSKKNILRNVLSTITSLAIDTCASHLMVFHGDGVLIEQLKRFVLHCEDFVARKRAIKAIRLLAKDPSSTPVMVLQNNELLEILSDRALHDTNDSVRAEATEAFANLANLVRAPMVQHDCVLDAVTRMLTTATTGNLDVLVRALQEQASHQVNRRAMVQHRNLIRALAALIRSENSALGAKESACATLEDLSEEPLNLEVIALPVLLDALVGTLIQPLSRRSNASANIDAIVTNRIRESSVKTILNLAETPSNRKDMARQTALIQSLLRFAAATTTGEDTKKRVKSVILQLATEL